MSILGSLLGALSNVADAARTDVERKSNAYSTGYERGASKAANMSDAELRSALKKAKENGTTDWRSAGQTRAMADEYRSRKNK